MEINLWQGKPAVSNGNDADTAKVYVYLPDAKTATGRAIVICPGGGYAQLAMNHEGKDWSGYLNNLGIAAIVLKYRMPNGNLEVPIADAEAAIKLVRDNASFMAYQPKRHWHHGLFGRWTLSFGHSNA